jgi:hypothetical protein
MRWIFSSSRSSYTACLRRLKRRSEETLGSSPHGPMLERILPPTFAPRTARAGLGGRTLTLRYCVQCHNLANPADAPRREVAGVVDRMVVRMEAAATWAR